MLACFPGTGRATSLMPAQSGEEPAPPRLRICFDNEATVVIRLITEHESTFAAYVFLADAVHATGGSRYALWLDPRLQLVAATYPPATVVGEPLTGVEVGFADCQAVGAPVLVSTLTVDAGLLHNIDNVELRVDPHPAAGMVEYFDCESIAYGVAGGSAFVTRVTPVARATWSAIRNLYRR